MKKTIFIAAIILGLGATTVQAERFTPIKDAKILDACGECHMTFYPQMLPQASWRNIINDLSNHFGEDASIDATTQAYVLNYHLNDSADVKSTRAARKWMKRVNRAKPPTRIVTAPRFVKKHNDRDFDRMWNRLKVKSKADCTKCHKDAQRGLFDDD
ncbi:MAG: cytochrome C [Magnetovibrio sp.]|nr:cytochrome C [Magnetovibrio sp.]